MTVMTLLPSASLLPFAIAAPPAAGAALPASGVTFADLMHGGGVAGPGLKMSGAAPAGPIAGLPQVPATNPGAATQVVSPGLLTVQAAVPTESIKTEVATAMAATARQPSAVPIAPASAGLEHPAEGASPGVPVTWPTGLSAPATPGLSSPADDAAAGAPEPHPVFPPTSPAGTSAPFQGAGAELATPSAAAGTEEKSAEPEDNPAELGLAPTAAPLLPQVPESPLSLSADAPQMARQPGDLPVSEQTTQDTKAGPASSAAEQLQPPSMSLVRTDSRDGVEPAVAQQGASEVPVVAAPPIQSGSPVEARLPLASEIAGRPDQPLRLNSDSSERLGVTIARHVAQGREEVQIRMDPAELGRIHVRLSFDEGGSLRAVVAAESPQVLETLRRDAGELQRSLSEAGIRTDAQSFRFDRGQHGEQGNPRQWVRGGREGWGENSSPEPLAEPASYRPLRRSARLDLMA